MWYHSRSILVDARHHDHTVYLVRFWREMIHCPSMEKGRMRRDNERRVKISKLTSENYRTHGEDTSWSLRIHLPLPDIACIALFCSTIIQVLQCSFKNAWIWMASQKLAKTVYCSDWKGQIMQLYIHQSLFIIYSKSHRNRKGYTAN
jgi:hypothetical protein